MRVSATVISGQDAKALASFYQQLLGWTVAEDRPGWVRLRHPSGDQHRAGLSFAVEADHVAPTWPTVPGKQQMMMHLDIGVLDLAEGVAWAIECGATPASDQPQDDVQVMLDPAGHPFCLFRETG